MLFQIGMENNVEGRSLAWILGHPGCFAYGVNGEAALAAAPQAIRAYIAWIEAHSAQSWLSPKDIEVNLADAWDVYQIDEEYQVIDTDGYEVNAWFQHDWLPLSQEEIQRGLLLLSWTRSDLLQTVSDLTPPQLEASYAGERWNIAGILGHVGGAEWWYLDRLGLAIPRDEVPDDPFQRLVRVRACLEQVLTDLAGVNQVVGVDGEFWSPRKLLRRAAWHERDHTGHIAKLLGSSPAA